jgi:transcription elongation factor GreA
MPKTPMTKHGAQLLQEELQRLKSVERPANSKAIGEARSHGDLAENAEYHAARERAGFIEGRIKDIESKLANAQVIDPKLHNAEGRCVFGATVDVEDGTGQQATWQIVGEDEADIKAGKISVSSPIARALIGKESGESVEVQTPGGVKRYEIVDVRYE